MAATQSPLRIFIVEDDHFYGELLKRHLELNPDNEVFLFQTGKECLDNLYKKPDVISLDYGLPDMRGDRVLKKIKEDYPDLPVIIVSGQEDIQTAVGLLKAGAYDYFVKDYDTKDRLWNAVNNIRQHKNLRVELDSLKNELGKKYAFRNIIKGNSPPLKKVFDRMDKAIRSNITVSITGETGTGKELVAKAIHYNSPRAKKPFIPINVSAIPNELIESELFGYEKGAFTGADTRKIGKFELANGGTLFLDEVAEMDMNMQTKLLRVIQEKELTRIGGHEVIKIDVRLIVATHRNLAEEVKKGNFRQDLYYRLLGLPIELPPLRNRGLDIILLAKHFAEQYCKENGLEPKVFTKKAQDKLMSYSYPGNVRELAAIVELATVMSDGNVIDAGDIQFSSAGLPSDILLEETTLADYNQKIIRYFLEKYDGNVVMTAKKLGIGKSTLYRMLKNKNI
ncbi:sigma-54 dependent transcriptional regulator [Candidatus Sulfidibacterium hydrothermale]|uniref:sigma-54-dependent transcriptional regulator n=1 Tax=Candidatus Sulfidibacterium hydrothermale TaxID=2875962 RepID=UPI001F0B60D7|nr:sigma-54 dependent transcriptional regulator [Candidatus Sulfidibacterium hydrothermale]UBM62058.1 sigma-54 dependent transcriptional regulator [Candidatus Sulfidibacterium hydrothermale]